MTCGVFDSPESFALAVSHPHPDNDHGGGPGPVDRWRSAYEFEAYRSLVDSGGDEDEDEDEDGVQYELREVRHVAICDHGASSLIELPAPGVIETMRAIDSETIAALVTYGGSAHYVWHYARHGGDARSFDILGLPQGVHHVLAALVGDSLLLVGRIGDQSVAATLEDLVAHYGPQAPTRVVHALLRQAHLRGARTSRVGSIRDPARARRSGARMSRQETRGPA